MITDRSMDLFAPFLHEFTYQAMCNDVLDIMEGKQYRSVSPSTYRRTIQLKVYPTGTPSAMPLACWRTNKRRSQRTTRFGRPCAMST